MPHDQKRERKGSLVSENCEIFEKYQKLIVYVSKSIGFHCVVNDHKAKRKLKLGQKRIQTKFRFLFPFRFAGTTKPMSNSRYFG